MNRAREGVFEKTLRAAEFSLFMDEQKVARINALARKKKSEGLTPGEEREQAALREEYLAGVRASLRGQLEGITIVRPDGRRERPRRKAPPAAPGRPAGEPLPEEEPAPAPGAGTAAPGEEKPPRGD